MKLTKRQVEILRYLEEYPEMTVKDLGNRLRLTVQTIKAELQNMSEILSSYGISIELPPGGRLKIRGRANFIQLLKSAKPITELPMAQKTMLILLMNDSFIVLQDIADALFVSKSLIEKLMAGLLKAYPGDLQSLRHYGIRCTLPQMEKRSLFVHLLASYFQGIDFRKETAQFDALHFPLLRYFDSKDVEQSAFAIDLIKQTEQFSFTDEAICQLYLYFIFILRHRRRQQAGRIGDAFAGIVAGLPGVDVYMATAKKLSRAMDLADDQNETAYICYLLMTLRKQKMLNHQEIVRKMQAVIREILETISQRLSIRLIDDAALFNGLAAHIYTTVLRRDMAKPLSVDYSWGDIRHQYPLSFEMAVIVAEMIHQRYGYTVPEDEMIYVTLHFQAAIERMKRCAPKIKTLVVCHYGVAAASLIETKVDRVFHAVEIMGSYSMHDFMRLNEPRCDLILSTERIPGRAVPVIYVTPALKENELKGIAEFIETKCMRRMLEFIVMESEVIHLDGEECPERILSIGAAALRERGSVTDAYLRSLVERERISSTDVGFYAIPHGNPDFVRETKLVVIRLAKPVMWKVSFVKYVFLFAISRAQFDDNFALFSTFYKSLVKSKMKDDVKKYDNLSDQELKKALVDLLGR